MKSGMNWGIGAAWVKGGRGDTFIQGVMMVLYVL
jgi:hypothetical protein